MRCNTYIETKLDGGGLHILECPREAKLDGKCYRCAYENLQKKSESEVNRLRTALEEIKTAKQSHCGTGASVARWRTCENMRKIATEALKG